MTPRLHCFGESGNSYKAALTLSLCGVEWEPVWLDFFNGAGRTPEFQRLNVMGEAPVLEAEAYDTGPGKTGLTPRDFLLYCYYGGLIHIGMLAILLCSHTTCCMLHPALLLAMLTKAP